MKSTKMYVNSIIEDVQTRFVNEKTISYSETKIERLYEFEDGAVVKYEWQSPIEAKKTKFNHRFTLTSLPKPNPDKLKAGVIRIINYGENDFR